MRVLVTGATGFVGRHLANRLAAGGADVHAVARSTSDVSVLPKTVTVHRHDDEDSARLREIVAHAAPDAAVHLASVFVAEHRPDDVSRILNANVVFATELVDALVDAGCSNFLNTGTTWQHYRDAPYDPVCLYAASKQAFETVLDYYVNARGLKVLTLKLNDTYGPDDPRRKLIGALLRAACSGEAISLSPGEQKLDFLHVADAVSAYERALDRLVSGEGTGKESFVALSGEQLSLRELVARIESITGRALPVDWGARPYRQREVMEPPSAGVPLPGWRPAIGLEEGLRELANRV